MKITQQQTEPCRKVVSVAVEAAEVDTAYAEVAKEFAGQVKIPGFRKGKAPVAIVEKRFARAIEDETKDRLIPRYYREALDAENIKAVAVVGVNDVSLSRGEGLKFSITIDIPPRFKVPKYKGLPLKSLPVELTDDEVNEAVEQLRERAASYQDVAGRESREGDLVQVDYDGRCGGRPIAGMSKDAEAVGHGRDFWVDTKGVEFIPGLAARVVGRSIGETADIPVEFPGDFPVKELAGTQSTYSVSVKAIREKKIPAINKEFLELFKVDSEQALRDRVRQNGMEAAEEQERRRLKGEIVQLLLARTDLEVPQSLVEDETRRAVQDIVVENSARGVSREELEEKRDEIVDVATKSSVERVKAGYVLDAIAEKEKITVEESEVEDRLELMAKRYGNDKEKLRREFEKRNSMAGLERSIRAEKTLDFLLERAKIKKK